ncbi:hypothetical protein [Candidatus Avelusimicrobium fimicolum]|uniref:hypothetical protein n=2 Tax=Candidatus Avelusimicrobium fimicolum TaxID=3416216 RepID=UPI003C7F1346|nr:hypothetical protein [Spirochaetia bacterium]
MVKYSKMEFISLKNHPTIKESWIQERIAEDPQILGLGNLILRDKERIQIGAGRLDLLLQDADLNKRYEVEIQLGKLDESHLIRTIEYWDIERNRYPQYDHYAVIIAEDITSRFLNVISLFNKTIPLIAIQMKAVKVGDAISLLFTTVLSEFKRGVDSDEEDEREVTDRHYWENRANQRTVGLVDSVVDIIHKFMPETKLKFNKFYIGVEKEGVVDNWVVFRPKKEFLRIEIRLPRSEELDKWLEDQKFDLMEYDGVWGRYRIVMRTETDIKQHSAALLDIFKKASLE